MTVGELRKALKGLPKDMEVFVPIAKHDVYFDTAGSATVGDMDDCGTQVFEEEFEVDPDDDDYKYEDDISCSGLIIF